MTGTSTLISGGASGGEIVDSGPGPALRIAYRRQLIRALNVKLRRGEISRSDYWVIRRASWRPDFIDAFMDEIVRAAKEAGDFLEDVKAWLRVLWQWLLDNWELVLKILVSLLLML